nr:MAG TPA: hypothetical protein [Caudoviricetes sp.]
MYAKLIYYAIKLHLMNNTKYRVTSRHDIIRINWHCLY